MHLLRLLNISVFAEYGFKWAQVAAVSTSMVNPKTFKASAFWVFVLLSISFFLTVVIHLCTTTNNEDEIQVNED